MPSWDVIECRQCVRWREARVRYSVCHGALYDALHQSGMHVVRYWVPLDFILQALEPESGGRKTARVCPRYALPSPAVPQACAQVSRLRRLMRNVSHSINNIDTVSFIMLCSICVRSVDCQMNNAPPWIPDIGRSYGEFTEIAFSQLGSLGFSTRYMNPTRRLIVLEHIFRLRR